MCNTYFAIAFSSSDARDLHKFVHMGFKWTVMKKKKVNERIKTWFSISALTYGRRILFHHVFKYWYSRPICLSNAGHFIFLCQFQCSTNIIWTTVRRSCAWLQLLKGIFFDSKKKNQRIFSYVVISHNIGRFCWNPSSGKSMFRFGCYSFGP